MRAAKIGCATKGDGEHAARDWEMSHPFTRPVRPGFQDYPLVVWYSVA
jgi:hypothetical protein